MLQNQFLTLFLNVPSHFLSYDLKRQLRRVILEKIFPIATFNSVWIIFRSRNVPNCFSVGMINEQTIAWKPDEGQRKCGFHFLIQ